MNITKSLEFKLPTRILFGVNRVDSLALTAIQLISANLREAVGNGENMPMLRWRWEKTSKG